MSNSFDVLRTTKKPRLEVEKIEEEKPQLSYFDVGITLISVHDRQSIGLSDTKCQVGLKYGQAWSFIGRCRARALKGRVEIMGHILTSSFVDCFSPTTHSPISFVARNVDAKKIDISDECAEFDASRGPFDAVFELESVAEDSTLDQVAKVMNSEYYGPQNDLREIIKRVYEATPGLYPVFIPQHWIDLIHAENQGSLPSVAICGPKNSGKSTFSRFAVNSLLEKYPEVCYLETDVGQCEFTPCGLVSLNVVSSPLLGPPFTHQTTQHCKVLGYSSPEQDPIGYFTKIVSLYRTYQDKYLTRGIPLVVNTHGWIRGMGLELVQQILQLVRPKSIIQFIPSTPGGQPNFSDSVTVGLKESVKSDWWEADAEYVQKIYLDSWEYNEITLHPVIEGNSLRSKPPALDLRNMSLISYLCQNNGLNETNSISLNVLEIKEFTEHPHNELLQIYNASIVALVSADENVEGLGVVLGIDKRRNALIISTPLPLDHINKRVKSISRFFVDVPIELYLHFSNKAQSIPYVDSHVIDGTIGHNIRKTRRNLLRKYHGR